MARGRPVGRRAKLTQERQHKIVQAVALGTPFGTACRYAGIHPDTAYGWLERGEYPAKAHIYAEFSEAIMQARAQDEMRRIGRIEQAARGGAVTYHKTTTYEDGRTITEERTAPPEWQADAWYLERRLPDSWGKKERVDVRLTLIEEAVAKIATETGMTPNEVLVEAQLLLQELDHADRA